MLCEEVLLGRNGGAFASELYDIVEDADDEEDSSVQSRAASNEWR